MTSSEAALGDTVMEVVDESVILDLEADKETEEEQGAVKEDDMDKNNFEKINDDKFKCKICEHEVNTEGGMKRHITTKHINPKESKKRKMDEKEDAENTEDKKTKVEETIDDPNDMSLIDRILGDISSNQCHHCFGSHSLKAVELDW